MYSEQIGWIPTRKELEDAEDIVEKFQIVYGLSVTEMEILQAAYRINNPNCELAFDMQSAQLDL
jgi:hypothetical protein